MVAQELAPDAVLPITQRLSTRLALANGVVLACVLALASSWLRDTELERARQSLRESGAMVVPFMVPTLRPALDFAVDETTGEVDPEMLQSHVVESAFAIARKNPEVAYLDLVLEGGTSVARYLADGVQLGAVQPLFVDGVRQPEELSSFVVHEGAVMTPDGERRLATLRLAFSLERAQARAWQTMIASFGLGVVVFLLAMVLITFFSNSFIHRPMGRLLAAARLVGAGKLRTDSLPNVRGEIGLIGRAFRAMTGALGEVVAGIQGTARAVTSAVQTANSSAERMLAGAREQAFALGRVIEATNAVEASSRVVDGSIEQLSAAAQSASAATTELSQRLNALAPEVSDFKNYVADTDKAMQEMRIAAGNIAERVESMTSSVEDAAHAVSGLEQSLTTIGQNAVAASSLSDTISQRALECRDAVGQTISGMGEISSAFTSIDHAVGGLGDRVDLIRQIIRVIGDITNRTKLLSLNASILASQAGEHGKGFAVVADEIKALSERTAQATRDIDGLIKSVDAEREKTRETMKAAVGTVHDGEVLSRKAGEAITTILDLTKRSNSQMAQIARETAEQVAGSKAVAIAANQVVGMGRGILEGTERQRVAAESITARTGIMVRSLEAMARSLEQEAGRSTQVAEEIVRMLQRAEAVKQESSRQRIAAARIVADVNDIRQVAKTVLDGAEQIARDTAGLRGRVDGLIRLVERFEVH